MPSDAVRVPALWVEVLSLRPRVVGLVLVLDRLPDRGVVDEIVRRHVQLGAREVAGVPARGVSVVGRVVDDQVLDVAARSAADKEVRGVRTQKRNIHSGKQSRAEMPHNF